MKAKNAQSLRPRIKAKTAQRFCSSLLAQLVLRVYMCSCLLQLAVKSCDFFQAEIFSNIANSLKMKTFFYPGPIWVKTVVMF